MLKYLARIPRKSRDSVFFDEVMTYENTDFSLTFQGSKLSFFQSLVVREHRLRVAVRVDAEDHRVRRRRRDVLGRLSATISYQLPLARR